MSLTSIPRFSMGGPAVSDNGVYTTLDAQNEKIGHCGYFVTPDGETRSITHICWSTQTVTTGDNILCQLESIDSATGLYNGIIAAGASGTQTVADSDDNKWFETALTTPYTLTSGTVLAATFKMLNASKNLRINKSANMGHYNGANMNWIVEELGGGAAAKASYLSNVALKCSTGIYLVPIGGDCNVINSYISINTGSNPRYVGNKVLCHTSSRISGVNIAHQDIDYNVSILLVDSSGNVLKGDDTITDMSITLDADYRYGTAKLRLSCVDFPCPKTLTADTAYYLIYSPADANNTNVYWLDYETEALKKQVHGIPANWSCSYVSSPSVVSFTEDVSKIACLYPIFDQIDLGSSGGGRPEFRGCNL